MDASYKIQRGIHVHLIQFFMCPEFWVHISVEFLFQDDHIRTTVGKEATSVRYREVSHLAALKDWRFLYFGQGAYIIPVSAFRDAAELDRFDTFITGKCGMPIVILEGEVPKS